MEEVKKDIFRYIEMFYNRKKRHSALEYMTPVEYRLKYDEKNSLKSTFVYAYGSAAISQKLAALQ